MLELIKTLTTTHVLRLAGDSARCEKCNSTTVVTMILVYLLDFFFSSPSPLSPIVALSTLLLSPVCREITTAVAPKQALGRQKGQSQLSAARSNPVGRRVVHICRKKRELYPP